MSPYKKLCLHFLGKVPSGARGNQGSGNVSITDLGEAIGMHPQSIRNRWVRVEGTDDRIIPPGSARRIEQITNGAVTEAEIREYASQHQSGEAA